MDPATDSPILMQPGDDIKPNASKETACQLVEHLYGLQVTAVTELNAYDDKNFHIIANNSSNPFITNVSPDGYVLKILNSIDSSNLPFIEGQNEILLYLRSCKINVPNPVQNKTGKFFSLECISSFGGNQKWHIVRLLQYEPGRIFKSVPCCRKLYYDAGFWLANLDNALKNFSHPVFEKHTTIWHLKSVPLLKSYMFVVKDVSRQTLVSNVVESYITHVIPKMTEMDKGIIHGDFNEQNILVQSSGDSEWRISAILDFGDCNQACYLFEIATAMCYMMLEARRNGQNIIDYGGETLRGYQSVRALSALECSLLKITICSRLCQSLVLGLYSQTMQPDNAYIGDTQAAGWAVLSELWETADQVLRSAWPPSQ